MKILDQIRIEETLELLKEWKVDVIDGTTKLTLDRVVSVMKHISSGKHSKATDSFIEKCDAALAFGYDVFYLDKNEVFSTRLVYEMLKAGAFAFDLLPKKLAGYGIHKKSVPLLVSLGTDVRELRKMKNIPLREKLQKEILEGLDVDLLAGLEKEKQLLFEGLCSLYFSKIQSLVTLNYLRFNCLNSFINEFLECKQIEKEWFLRMSEFILNKYMECRELSHQDLLKELRGYLRTSRKSSKKQVQSYAEMLFTDRSILDVLDEEELELFFDNDHTLTKQKKEFDKLMKSRMLKRHFVSELIFDQMKICSNHTNCKFNCKFEVCKYRSLLELLGSHLPQYDILKLEEKVGEDFQTDFVFVTDEDEKTLSLVLCCSEPYPQSSIYCFRVDKKQYMDALFVLFRYFESDYACKRKNLIKHMDHFGSHFGILQTRYFRK